MRWKKEDGMTGMEIVTVFAIFITLSITALPYYTFLTNNAHEARVTAMSRILNTTVIIASIDSLACQGSISYPMDYQIRIKDSAAWYNSDRWIDDENGNWTYLPNGSMITYKRINQNDYSININSHNNI